MADILFVDPAAITKPAARYSHTALVRGAARWLFVSGQLGIRADGTVPPDADAQADIIVAALHTALAAHGMTTANVVKLGTFLTTREARGAWQARRDAMFPAGAPPASTQLIVAGLAHPDCVIEVEMIAAD